MIRRAPFSGMSFGVTIAVAALLNLCVSCDGDGGGFAAPDGGGAADAVDTGGGGADAGADVAGDDAVCPPGGCDPEICDGLDNDGDGDVDEELGRVCNTACGSGSETCVNGQWIGCDAPEPQTEICDGLDNDCDGRVDEDLVRDCETACGQGREMCALGSWTGCNAPPALPETCNGADDDCDGQSDEDLSRSCSSVCGDGAEVCADGAWGACSARQPEAAEVCDDNVDNDCDGTTDEECGTCPAGNTTVCQGVAADERCRFGTRLCGDDGAWGPCVYRRGEGDAEEELDAPGEEVCNGRDDDCDGGVDETFPGAGDPCGADGAPAGEGECLAGALACEAGVEVCQGFTAPVAEVCDGRDNDCDGVTDDDLPRDAYERNDACAAAAAVGDIREGSPALTWAASIYPFGDADFFFVSVEEGGGWCVPSINPDDDYAITVTLSNVPEGVSYDLCVTITDRVDTPAQLCEEPEPVLERTCVTTPDADGDRVFTHTVVTDCLLADHTSLLVEVVPTDGAATSCESYTLSVQAETVVTDEE